MIETIRLAHATMAKILVVFGASGHQGGSVVNYVLNNTELSKQYQIRALVNNVDSSKAKALKEKVDVVQVDQNDRESISKALHGAAAAFVNTVPSFGEDAVEKEFQVIKSIADAAVAQGVNFLILSTLAACAELTGGRLKNLTAFDSKAKGAAYVRTLPIKSAFFSAGSFMENYQEQAFLGPKRQADGSWVLARPMSPKARIPLIAAADDAGKFVGAILAEPSRFEGKTVHAGTAMYDHEQIAEALSKSSGERITYKQVSAEEFSASLPSWAADIFVDGYLFYEDPGYFGPGTPELLEEGARVPREELTSFEKFLELHPFKL